MTSKTSIENCRWSLVAVLFMSRTWPMGVYSHWPSDGLTTFFICPTPGVQTGDQSTRSPNSSGRLIGPLRPCWIRPMNIQVLLAFITRQTARSSYGL